MKSLESEVKGLEEQLETRKVVDRAKGMLMDQHGMSENDAFSFIQKTAMQHRVKTKVIAQQLIDGEISPPESASG
jgi:response regulator NasT